MSLLLDGADVCNRCSNDVCVRCSNDVCVRCTTGIRSIGLAETPIDERINFQNPFERVMTRPVISGFKDRLHPVSNSSLRGFRIIGVLDFCSQYPLKTSGRIKALLLRPKTTTAAPVSAATAAGCGGRRPQ